MEYKMWIRRGCSHSIYLDSVHASSFQDAFRKMIKRYPVEYKDHKKYTEFYVSKNTEKQKQYRQCGRVIDSNRSCHIPFQDKKKADLQDGTEV